MCGFSIEGRTQRKATVGERLVSTTFGNHGSVGLATPEQAGHAGILTCVLDGAKIQLTNIPVKVQEECGVGASELVVFSEHLAKRHYRDGFIFANGKQVLLQSCGEGLTADILSEAEYARRQAAQRSESGMALVHAAAAAASTGNVPADGADEPADAPPTDRRRVREVVMASLGLFLVAGVVVCRTGGFLFT